MNLPRYSASGFSGFGSGFGLGFGAGFGSGSSCAKVVAVVNSLAALNTLRLKMKVSVTASFFIFWLSPSRTDVANFKMSNGLKNHWSTFESNRNAKHFRNEWREKSQEKGLDDMSRARRYGEMKHRA
jgi:hypothetical protein